MFDSGQSGSLSRFLKERGVTWMFRGRRSWRVQVFVGWLLVAVAASMAVVASMFLQDGSVLIGATGPFIGGVVNLVVGYAYRANSQRTNDFASHLTPEASALLSRLIRSTMGWRYAWGLEDLRIETTHLAPRAPAIARAGVRPSIVTPGIVRTRSPHWRASLSSMGIAQTTFDLLERAAFEYNRVAGALSASSGSGSPELMKMTPAIRSAMDQTMADLFHRAALMERYPESYESSVAEADDAVKSMCEVADRIGRMRTRDRTLTERLESTSPLESVLEDLRMDEVARRELNPMPPQQQKLTSFD